MARRETGRFQPADSTPSAPANAFRALGFPTPGRRNGPRRRAVSRAGGAPRFMLYSHDSWGLGHLRRSLNIASGLTAAFPDSNALIVTGSPCAMCFPAPPRVDMIKLPSVSKDAGGRYVPRSLSGPLPPVLRLRRRLLLESFRTFAPHLLIVDHQALGLHGEALGMLREARRQGTRTLFGMRDIVDSPDVVERQLGSPECRWALAEGYDRLCVYGSPEVFDPRVEYPNPPEVAARAELTGYVVRPPAVRSRRPFPALRPQVVVTTGGGEDGAERISAYLDALALGPVDWDSTLITGPLLSAAEARRIRRRARLLEAPVTIHGFHPDLPRLLRDSDAVVAMAGYNTAAEVLLAGKPAVFLPRTFPRREQLIRAQRLARLGLAQSLVDPAPDELREAVLKALTTTDSGRLPDLEGRHRLCEIAGELLSLPLRTHHDPVEARFAS